MTTYLPCPAAAYTVTFTTEDITGVAPDYEDSPPGGFQAKRLRVFNKARASQPKAKAEDGAAPEVKLTAVMGEKTQDSAGSGVFESATNAKPQPCVGFDDVKVIPAGVSDVFGDVPAGEPVIKAVAGFNDVGDAKPQSASLIL